MTITTETGAGLPNAESYASVAGVACSVSISNDKQMRQGESL